MSASQGTVLRGVTVTAVGSTMSATTITADAQIERLERAFGPLYGEFLGDPVALQRTPKDGSVVRYFASTPALEAEIGLGIELMPGLRLEVGAVDLRGVSVLGGGAKAWSVRQCTPGIRQVSLPDMPLAWRAAVAAVSSDA